MYTTSEGLHDSLKEKLAECQELLVELVFKREGTFTPEYEAKLQNILLQVKAIRQEMA